MVESLSEEEIVEAAYTSYAYWVKENVYDNETTEEEENNNNNNDTTNLRIKIAMKEARRHYVGQSGNVEIALQNMKNTLAWRKVRKKFGDHSGIACFFF